MYIVELGKLSCKVLEFLNIVVYDFRILIIVFDINMYLDLYRFKWYFVIVEFENLFYYGFYDYKLKE